MSIFLYPPSPAVSGGATSANQDVIISELQSANVDLAAIELINTDIETNTADSAASLAAMEADVDALNAKLAASLVPEAYDYIALTYVAAGNGVGEIETVIYKTGGAVGTTVATLTLAYNGDNKLSSTTRS